MEAPPPPGLARVLAPEERGHLGHGVEGGDEVRVDDGVLTFEGKTPVQRLSSGGQGDFVCVAARAEGPNRAKLAQSRNPPGTRLFVLGQVQPLTPPTHPPLSPHPCLFCFAVPCRQS